MSFNSGRLSHAYITDDSFVDRIAMAVVCSARDTARPCMMCVHCGKASRHIHPDITVVGRLDDKLIISVDQIRELKKDVYIVPNEATQKAYIVYDADSMNANAQNAFLQILEEPPAHAVFILCTGNPAALLPTVRSRCVELKPRFGTDLADRAIADSVAGSVTASDAESVEEHNEFEELLSYFITALEGDNVKLAECMFRLDKLNRPALFEFLALAREMIVISLRGLAKEESFTKRKAFIHAESILVKAGEMLDLNVSAGNIAGFICASLMK